jgi:hypothetical protein
VTTSITAERTQWAARISAAWQRASSHRDRAAFDRSEGRARPWSMGPMSVAPQPHPRPSIYRSLGPLLVGFRIIIRVIRDLVRIERGRIGRMQELDEVFWKASFPQLSQHLFLGRGRTNKSRHRRAKDVGESVGQPFFLTPSRPFQSANAIRLPSNESLLTSATASAARTTSR